jgi:serpin B
MKKSIYPFVFFGIVALCFIACEKVEEDGFPEDKLIERKDFVLTRSELEFIQNNNDFAIELFKRVADNEEGKSMLISPLSVTIDLGMVNNGALGETREEISRVLGYPEGSVDGLNSFCQSMLVQSAGVDPTTTLNIANAAIINKLHVPLKDHFTKAIQSFYDAEVFYKEFGKDDVKGLVNEWCAEKTKGMIPVFLEQQPLPYEYAHFINAVYFKGGWSRKFDKKDTKQEAFTREDGSRSSMKMMWQKGQFEHGGMSGLCQALCLPYGNQAYRMIVLLPFEEKTIEDVKDALDADTWNSLLKGMNKSMEAEIKLPVFETTTPLLSLGKTLSVLGMQRAFSLQADFSAMTDYPIHIDDIIQMARIKVDETGSEAAAVTDITMSGAGPNPGELPVIRFYCDRPFLYVITEVSSGAIFFMGQFTGK